MPKFSKVQSGEFTPKNPDKYKGRYPINYRSSWELTVFNMFDAHPNVLEWASESLKIPYMHPFKGNMTYYVPDIVAKFIDKNGRQHVEVIEIKPLKETLREHAKSRYDQAMIVINEAKWKAAQAFCSRQGMRFRILTENQIYSKR